jgi:hypothetical protein
VTAYSDGYRNPLSLAENEEQVEFESEFAHVEMQPGDSLVFKDGDMVLSSEKNGETIISSIKSE